MSIKHQCSHHNFYGFAPRLEEAFSAIEGEAAEQIRNIRSTKVVPSHGTPEWESLLAFIVFQKLRTSSAARMNDVMTDYLAKMWLENHPDFKDIPPDSFEISNVYPIAIPLTAAGDVLKMVTDLQMHLLVNETSREFTTSDDPVVMHNQYCEGIDYRGVSGWNCRGLQVMWPISPEELILLFDPGVYKVGAAHKGSHVTLVSNERDIDQLNSLQIMNATHNVYFAGVRDFTHTVQQCQDLSSRRPKERFVFVEAEGPNTDDGRKSGLVHSYEPLLPVTFSISAVTLRKKARRISLHSRAAMYRNPIERSPEEQAAYGDAPAGRYAIKRIVKK